MLNKAAGLITHKKFDKGSYIFRQDEKSDYFYGIISGKISIREKKRLIQETKGTNNNFNHISDKFIYIRAYKFFE